MSRSEEIQNLINQYDLRDFAERELGIKRHGNSNSFHCFAANHHKNGDANPSLVIYKEYFKCFGCGISGDIFNILHQCKNLDFKEALAYLGKTTSVPFIKKPRLHFVGA